MPNKLTPDLSSTNKGINSNIKFEFSRSSDGTFGGKFSYSVQTTVLDEIIIDAAKGGTNLVYQGVDKAGVVRYVGITERAAAARFGEHLSSGTAKSLLRYEVVPGATNLSRTGAMVWEQGLINQYGLQKNGGLLLNKINSISPTNWWQYGIK